MKERSGRFVRILLTAACAAVFLGSAGLALHRLWEYGRGDKDLRQVYELAEAAEQALSGQPGTGEALADTDGSAGQGRKTDVPVKEGEKGREPEQEAGRESEQGLKQEREQEQGQESSRRLLMYGRLKKSNPDMVGWVRIPETRIDYPVMQTPDEPDFYLNKGFGREDSVYGMIYMDASCNLKESVHNFILYGHHMRNGAMFAQLEQYREEEFYKEHKTVCFDTLGELGEYEVAGAFSIGTADIENEFLANLPAQGEAQYRELIRYVKEHSYYDTGITPLWPQQLVTLVTCEYTHRDGRLFVVARKTGS